MARTGSTITVKKNQIWQRAHYGKLRHQIRNELLKNQTSLMGKTAMEFIRRRLSELVHDASFEGQLKRFIYVLEGIGLSERESPAGAALKQVKSFKNTALKILEEQEIKPSKSNLSVLYRDLYEELSRAGEVQGPELKQVWSAGWLKHLANHCDPSNVNEVSSAGLMEALSRRFSGVTPVEWISRGIPAKTDSGDEDFAFELRRIRTMRLSGQALEAQALMEEVKRRHTLSDRDHFLLKWEKVFIQIQLTGDLWPLVQLTNKIPVDEFPATFLEAQLWILAHPSTGWLRHLSGLTRIQKELSETDADQRKLKYILKCVEVLRDIDNSSIPLLTRLDHLGEILSGIELLEDPQLEAVVLAGAARWLYRLKQPAMARWVALHYGALSEFLSLGLCRDSLTLLHDIQENIEVPIQEANLTSSWPARTAKTFALAAELAGALSHQRVKKLFADGKRTKRVNDEEFERIVGISARYLNHLKGPLLKLGQHLSYAGLDLTPRAKAILTRLQDQSYQVDFSKIKQVVEEEFSQPLDVTFAEFHQCPIGVGSIGQVHRARLWDGTPVAVKVQYPHIKDIIDSDVRNLRTLLPVSKVFSPRFFSSGLLEEIRTMLHMECDYLREGRWQEYFRNKYANHPILEIPKVHFSHSGKKVLTTGLVNALPFYTFVRTASVDQRKRAGEAIIYFVARSYDEGIFNSDPHPGNFLFTGDKVYLLDFGSVKKWTASQAIHPNKLFEAALSGSFDVFKNMIDGMGIVTDKKRFDYRSFYEAVMLSDFGKLTSEEPLVISPQKVRQSFVKMFDLKSQNLKTMTMPPQYLFGFRIAFSHLLTLAELESPLESRKVMLKALSDNRRNLPKSG